MRKILRRKLWEKRCDWRGDQHTDPTTYLAIIQPCDVGIYLVVRTRYGGMSVRSITDAEKYRIVAEDELEVSSNLFDDHHDHQNCNCEGCREKENALDYEIDEIIHNHRCNLNHEARRDCGQAIKIEGQECCDLKKGCTVYPDEYGDPVYDE